MCYNRITSCQNSTWAAAGRKPVTINTILLTLNHSHFILAVSCSVNLFSVLIQLVWPTVNVCSLLHNHVSSLNVSNRSAIYTFSFQFLNIRSNFYLIFLTKYFSQKIIITRLKNLIHYLRTYYKAVQYLKLLFTYPTHFGTNKYNVLWFSFNPP